MVSPTQVLNGMLAALEGGGQFRRVDVIENLIGKDLDSGILTPAAYVSYDGSDWEPYGESVYYTRSMSFSVILFLKTFVPRSVVSDTGREHIIQHLDSVNEALIGQTFGLEIWPLQPEEDAPVDAGEDFVVWRMSFSTRARFRSQA